MAEGKGQLEKLMTIYQYQDTGRVRIETSPTFEDPFAWGIVLVDAMRILADSYAKDEGATNAQPYLERIKEGLDNEYEHYTSPVELTGPVKEDNDDDQNN